MFAATHARVSRRPAGVPAILLALSVVWASPAAAQLGGLVNKAKDKLVRDAGDKSGANAALEGEPVVFNDVIIELTPATLDKVITGLKASRARLGGASGRQALVAKRDKAADDAAELLNRHGVEIDRHNEKRDRIEQCRNEDLGQREAKRQEDLSQRAMTDPELRDKVMALSMKAAELQSRGDSAGLRDLEKEMRSLTAATKADSAAVDKACGILPARHPMDARIRALQAEQASYDRQIRDLEEAAATEEARASGLPARQFAMARERIEMYLARVKSNSRQHGLTTPELQALNARRADLQQVM